MLSAPTPIRFTDAEIAEYKPLMLALSKNTKTQAAIKAELGAEYPRFQEYVNKVQADIRAKKAAAAQQSAPASSSSASQVVPRSAPSSSSSSLSDDGETSEKELFDHLTLELAGRKITDLEIYQQFNYDREKFGRFKQHAIAIEDGYEARCRAREAEAERLRAIEETAARIAALETHAAYLNQKSLQSQANMGTIRDYYCEAATPYMKDVRLPVKASGPLKRPT